MIKIEFTCYSCGGSSEIVADDIEEKMIVPVCNACYDKFLLRKGKLIKSFKKKFKSIYSDYDIPSDTFSASADITMEEE